MLEIKKIDLQDSGLDMAMNGAATVKVGSSPVAVGDYHVCPAGVGTMVTVHCSGNNGSTTDIDSEHLLTVELTNDVSLSFTLKAGQTVVDTGIKGIQSGTVKINGVEKTVSDDYTIAAGVIDLTSLSPAASADDVLTIDSTVVVATGTAEDNNVSAKHALQLKSGEVHFNILANCIMPLDHKLNCTSFIVRGTNQWNVVGGDPMIEIKA